MSFELSDWKWTRARLGTLKRVGFKYVYSFNIGGSMLYFGNAASISRPINENSNCIAKSFVRGLGISNEDKMFLLIYIFPTYRTAQLINIPVPCKVLTFDFGGESALLRGDDAAGVIANANVTKMIYCLLGINYQSRFQIS